MYMPKMSRDRKSSEASFTLMETVMALGMMAFIVIEFTQVQGNSIYFTEYGRNVTQASWLTKRVMSQVEYNWATRPFEDMETSVKERKFEEFPDYTWSLEIKEWKLPLTQILANGGMSASDEGEESGGKDDSMSQMIQTGLDQALDGEPAIMTARVDVSWAEGAARNSTGATLLLTNQSKLNEVMLQFKPIYDKMTKPKKKKKRKKGKRTNNRATAPPPAP